VNNLLVNLLDPAYREPVLTERQKRTRFFAGLAVVLLSVVLVVTGGRYLSMVHELSRTQEKLAAIDFSVTELNQMRQEKERLDAETAALYQELENNFSTSQLLKDLQNSLPGDAYLSAIRLDPDGILLISGGSKNLEMAGIYLNQIARLSYLKDTVLLSVNKDSSGPGQRFQIRAVARALAAAAATSPEGGEAGAE